MRESEIASSARSMVWQFVEDGVELDPQKLWEVDLEGDSNGLEPLAHEWSGSESEWA